MGRTGYLPSVFARTNKNGCPTVGLIVPGTIALIVTVLTNDTGLMVTISVFAALIMYVLAIVSTFIMRKKEPNLERPFSAGKIMPVLALIFVIVLFVCVLWANISALIWVILVYVVAIVYYLAYGKKNIRPIEEEFNM
jgi:ethanolamine permease